jgi:3-hydroxybutyryl-CoA dehydrogenase
MIIKKIGVIGTGIMGSGIAQVAAQAGFTVFMVDVENKFIQNAFDVIKNSLERFVKAGKITENQKDEIIRRIEGTVDLKDAVKDADIIIEATPEEMDLKKRVFKELDEYTPDHTILATNTSSLSITEIASATKRPDKVIGMHFSNPVPMMEMVEIIKGLDTSDETLNIIVDLSKKMNKEPIICNRDSPGFIGNRFFPLFINEAIYTLMEGIATKEDIDKAAKIGLHHPMGPLELCDFTGLDTILHVLEYLHGELGEKFRPCPLLKQMVRAGYLGRKTGRGFYTYTKER